MNPDVLVDQDGEAVSVEDLFEYGYCHALALALNRMTGWPIVGLEGRTGIVDHYLVLHPDGWLVDVRGTRAAQEVLDAWGDGTDYYTVVWCYAEDIWATVRHGDMEDPADVWELACCTAHDLVYQGV